MQVCMATKDRNDEKIERTYDEIGEILHQEGRGQVNAIVIEDLCKGLPLKCSITIVFTCALLP